MYVWGRKKTQTNELFHFKIEHFILTRVDSVRNDEKNI